MAQIFAVKIDGKMDLDTLVSGDTSKQFVVDFNPGVAYPFHLKFRSSRHRGDGNDYTVQLSKSEVEELLGLYFLNKSKL